MLGVGTLTCSTCWNHAANSLPAAPISPATLPSAALLRSTGSSSPEYSSLMPGWSPHRLRNDRQGSQRLGHRARSSRLSERSGQDLARELRRGASLALALAAAPPLDRPASSASTSRQLSTPSESSSSDPRPAAETRALLCVSRRIVFESSPKRRILRDLRLCATTPRVSGGASRQSEQKLIGLECSDRTHCRLSRHRSHTEET